MDTVTLALSTTNGWYRLVLLLHLVAVVVGFGSGFVWPYLAGQARRRGRGEGLAFTEVSAEGSLRLTTVPIWVAGALGIVLVVLGDGWAFDQAWISAAFALFIIGVVVATFLHSPNLKRMLELQRELAEGPAPGGGDGPPPQVAELQTRGKRAGMYGGILHLAFLLLMIDMIWKPGL